MSTILTCWTGVFCGRAMKGGKVFKNELGDVDLVLCRIIGVMSSAMLIRMVVVKWRPYHPGHLNGCNVGRGIILEFGIQTIAVAGAFESGLSWTEEGFAQQ